MKYTAAFIFIMVSVFFMGYAVGWNKAVSSIPEGVLFEHSAGIEELPWCADNEDCFPLNRGAVDWSNSNGKRGKILTIREIIPKRTNIYKLLTR